MRKALILLAMLGSCRSETVQTAAPMQIDSVTSVAEASAPVDAGTLKVAITLGASDPAMVRLYAWTPEQAPQVTAHLAQSGGKVERWAMGSIASKPVAAGPNSTWEFTAPVRGGWLYAVAIEPLSAQHGGTFSVPHVSMTFGKD